MLACGASEACKQSDDYCSAARRNLITCRLMFMWEILFFEILQATSKEIYKTENVQTGAVLQERRLLPPRCMFLTHRNTLNHYYVSTLSLHDNFQLNNTLSSHSRRQKSTAAALFLFKCDSFNSCFCVQKGSAGSRSRSETARRRNSCFFYRRGEKSSE